MSSEVLSNVVLIGFMGCGKTSVGRELARLCGNVLIDTDELIETNYGMTIAEFFALFGELRFREAEVELCDWMKDNLKNAVIASGGGLPTVYDLREIGKVIYLESSFEELQRRVMNDKHIKRPLFDKSAADLYARRVAIYEQMADYTLNALDEIPQIARKIYNYIRGY